jgi:benzylsuccinate CoA-transferase BbsF subunit
MAIHTQHSALSTQHSALAGIRVMEFGTGYVGPVLAMRLSEFGADVIKVESRRGLDFMRSASTAGFEQSPSFFDVNRNKRSASLDATTPGGHDALLRLVARTDVVVENFGAGVMRRLGLDYPALRAVKPDLIMASLQGLGATAGHSLTLGQNLPPLIGLIYLWNHAGAAKPVGTQLFHPDYFAGVMGSVIVMALLDHRRRTGQGHYLDASQAELAASLLGPQYLDWTINRRVAQPRGNRAYPGAPVGCYPCAPTAGGDAAAGAGTGAARGAGGRDAWCVIAVQTDAEWQGFCRALGAPAWTREPRFATLPDRERHREALDALVAEWTRQRTPHQVMDTLQAEGVPAGAAQTIADVMDDPQLQSRGFFVTLEHAEMGTIPVGGVPMRLSATPGSTRTAAPLVGEHTVEVLEDWLGLSAEEIARLESEGALR